MRQALDAGVKFFQYRSKNGSRKSIYEVSLVLARIARNAEALFIVNDHADIAAAVDADGVHLGQDDLPIEFARKLPVRDRIIGISTHGLDQARAAEAAGADYIGFGPLFRTSTKDAGQTKGIQNLAIVKKSVAIPVIAIGGINQANIQFVAQSGADGAAVISVVLAASDIRVAAEQLVGIWANETLRRNQREH
jgi:thiamine-phosphate pyrophosphorylase